MKLSNQSGEQNKIFLIIDDVSQIPKISLNERFDIVSYIMVGVDGTITYFGGSDNEDK